MTKKLSHHQLESFLWETSVILGGNMDASAFKDYIFGMMFLKRLSASYEKKQEKVIRHYLSTGKTQQQEKQLASDENMYQKVKDVPQKLLAMMDQKNPNVDFFEKRDKRRKVRRNIKREIIAKLDNISLVKPVADRFMERAEVKFR